jgi:tRNA 2-thiouridine synthesizing protein A
MTADAPVVDARGLKCPWPTLRLARAMRSNTELVIVADDPIAPEEIAALADQQGWTTSPVATPFGPGFRISR